MKNLPIPNIQPAELEHPPVERAETIPSHWYTAPEFHELDIEAVLGTGWQCAGHISRIPEAGDAYPLLAGGNPVLILRDSEGEVRAFYNVCRHRGGPLLQQPGSARFLKCLYHGWTYRLDGSLRGVPHFDRAELFDKDAFGLTPLRCEIRQGFIWISLQEAGAEPHPPLDELLHGIQDRTGHLNTETLQFAGEVVYEVACNWKVYIDNYLEGYHIPHVHPELCDLLSFQDYKTECAKWHSLQYSPFRQAASIYSDGSGEAYYYFVYPNTMLNILPGRVQLNRVEPVDAGHCRVHFEYYYDDVTSEAGKTKHQQDMAYSDKVQQEDMEICEAVQLGLRSKAYDRGRFSPKMETALHHCQGLLKQSYARFLTL